MQAFASVWESWCQADLMPMFLEGWIVQVQGEEIHRNWNVKEWKVANYPVLSPIPSAHRN